MPKLSKVGVRFEWDDVLLKRMVVSMIANAARQVDEINGFHAHIYYQMDATRATALMLNQQISAQFPLRVSQMVDRAIGPHPSPMFEVDFYIEDFASFVPWLMLNRQGLNVLIHPNTSNMLADHEELPIWLGDKQPLNTARMAGRSGF